MKPLSRWLQKINTGWLVLASLGVFLLFLAVVLPAQSRRAEAYTRGAGSPDSSLFYSPQTLYDYAETYGPEGRQAYIRARLGFDLIWPLSYAFFLTSSLTWLLSRGFSEESPWQSANLAPLLGLGFDLLENLASVIVMARYPVRTDPAAWLAVLSTPLKWLFVGGSFLLLALAGLAALRQALASDKKRQT